MPREDSTVRAGPELQPPGFEDAAGVQDLGSDAGDCVRTDAIRPEDFELQAYEDQFSASLTPTEDELEDEVEVKAAGEASPSDERQLSLDVREPQAAQAPESAESAPGVPAIEEPVSSGGKREDRLDSTSLMGRDNELNFDADYFEKWSFAAVNRMGNLALSRATFADGTARITLETEDLAKFAPEVDWLASRFCILVHQQSGRFKGIKAVPGLVDFQIVVILDLAGGSER